MAWINKIRYKADDSNTDQYFDLGTTFDRVYSDSSRKFSLVNLAEVLKTFFSRPAFMIYSTLTPADDSKVVEFYSITGDIENIASNFKNVQ